MLFAIFMSINLIALIFFATIPKKLNIMEILLVWIIVAIIYQSFIAVMSVNLGWIKLSEQLDHSWILVMNRLILIPLFLIWLMDRYISSGNLSFKLLATAVVISMLVCSEYVMNTLEVIRMIRWKL
jgi:hypothetical protein